MDKKTESRLKLFSTISARVIAFGIYLVLLYYVWFYLIPWMDKHF